MPLSYNTYTGNGTTTDYALTFSYLDPTYVKASINGTATTSFSFLTASTIRFASAPANGAAIQIYRETPSSALLADFTAGSAIREQDLELDFQQVLNVTQESKDYVDQQDTAGLLSQVTVANNNASAAVVTANAATTTANGIAATANTALTNANSAVTTANSASTTANNATTTANSALTIANAAMPKSGGTFTGSVVIPAGSTITGFAPLASPTFTGTVTIPAGASITGYAPTASPTFTGTVTIPTGGNITSPNLLGIPNTPRLRLNGATSGFTDIIPAATASSNTLTLPSGNGTSGQSLVTNGSGVLSWASPMTFDTAKASTSGTAVDFTGFPSGVRRITVMMYGVSTSGTGLIQIRLIVGGTAVTSGYEGSGGGAVFSIGFGEQANLAAAVRHGHLLLTQLSSTIWVGSGCIGRSDAGDNRTIGGAVTIAGTVTGLRVATNGVDTFDAGQINVIYES